MSKPTAEDYEIGRIAIREYLASPIGAGNRRITAALQPLIAERERLAKQQALREAIEDVILADESGLGGNDWFPTEWAAQVAGWLAHRHDDLYGPGIQAKADQS